VQLIEQLALSSAGTATRRSKELLRRLTRLASEGQEIHTVAASGTRGVLFVDVVRAITDLLTDSWTLCVIEDVQWADRDTRDMLLTLSESLFATPRHLPLVLVFTERTQAIDASQFGASLERATRAGALYLGPLEEIEIDEMIRASGIEHPSRSLVRTLFELSAGNPFYVGESLRRIEQLGGFVDRPGGVDTRVSLAELGPPEDLVKLVRRRLDALAPDAIELLTVASLLRGRIDPELLAEVLDQPVEDAIAAATADGFFVETTDGLEFAHPLTRRVLSEYPTREKRRALHRNIAAALRARPVSEHAARVADIAHHLEAGGLANADDDTLAFLWLAGRHAYELGAWADAARFFDAGVRVSEQLDADALVYRWMKFGSARSHDQNYNHAIALERYADVKALAGAIDDRDLLGRAVLADLRLRELVRSTDTAPAPTDTRELDDVLAQIGEHQPRLRSRLLMQYCVIEMGRARHQEGFQRGEEAARLARVSEDPVTVASAESTLGMASLSIGDGSAGKRRLERALASLPKRRRPDLEGITLGRLAITQLMLGELDDAQRSASAARQTYGAIADHKGVCLAETIHASLAVLRGDFAAVEEHAHEAEVHLRLSRDWFAPMVLYPALAEARSAQGDDAGAETALQMWKATGQGGRGPARLLLAARAGQLERVHGLLGDGRSHLALATWPSLFGVGMIGAVAEATRTFGRTDLTAQLLDALKRARDPVTMFSPGWGASAARVRALLLATQGETEFACAAYRDAIERMDEIGALPELARSSLDLGRLLLTLGGHERDEAYESLVAALVLSRQLGMPALTEEAEVAIAGLRRSHPTSDYSSGERDRKVVMFTDIVESTRVSVEAGDDIYMELVDDHDAIVRRHLVVHRGTEANSMGDGILAWFTTPAAALACATAIHTDVHARNTSTGRRPLELRIGLVLGRPIEREGNVYGAVVNLASRLCAAAQPGQVIVDANLRKVAPTHARFVTLDPLTLKGFADPVLAFSLTPG
jgi:class 3 adenylate cyclase